jgi:hypothetical protein
MRNHTTPKFHELVSTAGKNPSLTPGTTAQTATFLLNNLPLGKNNSMWYYTTAIYLKVVVTVDQAAMGGTAINADKLWKIIQSVQIQSPLLGQVFLHSNTRGAVLGNLIQYFGYGFNGVPVRAQVAAADGDTTVTLYYRIPFAYEFLRKPHESSPWAGFLEGGTFEVKLDVSTVLDGDSTGAVLKAPTNLRAWLELIPAPEAVIHTPVHWREHQTPGNSTRHVIQDFGSPDGLQGIDQSRGVGLAALLMLTDATGIGLSGPDGADNILSYDIPWRNQDRVDIPDAPYAAMYAMMGNNRRPNLITGVTADGAGFPYTMAATPLASSGLNDAQALVFPLVACGRDLETSKLQTVAGAKEVNFTYTATPSSISRFVGCYFPVFDNKYLQMLAARIAPGHSGKLVAKTLNKQAGGVHGVGKLAYVRSKVK